VFLVLYPEQSGEGLLFFIGKKDRSNRDRNGAPIPAEDPGTENLAGSARPKCPEKPWKTAGFAGKKDVHPCSRKGLRKGNADVIAEGPFASRINRENGLTRSRRGSFESSFGISLRSFEDFSEASFWNRYPER
jgi:hypothetical protein